MSLTEIRSEYNFENTWIMSCCRVFSVLQGELLSPCRCDGSVRCTHQPCLIRWISERGSWSCELCYFKYQVLAISTKNPLQVAWRESAPHTDTHKQHILAKEKPSCSPLGLLLLHHLNKKATAALMLCPSRWIWLTLHMGFNSQTGQLSVAQFSLIWQKIYPRFRINIS